MLGIAGLVGSGRSELGAALFGHATRSLPAARRVDAPRLRIGLVPEDRRLEGLMMQMSVLENATLAVLPACQPRGLHRAAAERAAPGPGRRPAGAEVRLADRAGQHA